MPKSRVEMAFLAVLLGASVGCASTQDDAGALANAVNGTGAAGGDVGSSGGSTGAGGGDTGNGGTQSGSGGSATGTGGFATGTGGFDTGTGGFDTSAGGTGTAGSGSGTGGLPPFSFGGAASTPDAGSSLKATCAQKLCIDPVFDCVLQGCGFAACTNLHCIVQ